MEKTNDELIQRLGSIESSLHKLSSYKYQFTKGVISGLGSAIGATIIFALMIIMLDRLIRQVGDIPVITPILQFINSSVGR